MGKYKMLERSFTSNDIIGLLSKLKLKTPDYPVELLAARKAAFLKQAATVHIDSPNQGGKGGGDGGGSLSGGSGGSGALGGMTTAQGILLQAVIGVWVIAAMLTAAYVFRNQIVDLLQDYGVVSVEMTQVPYFDSPAPVTEIPSQEVPPTETIFPTGTAVPGVISNEETSPETSSDTQDASGPTDENNDNQGLHLGQTPGPPDPPNQDKPDKPEKKK